MRKEILRDLEKLGLLERQKTTHTASPLLPLRHGDEPYLSDQWL